MSRIVVIAEEEERKLVEQFIPGNTDPVIVTGVGAINIIRALRDLPFDTEIVNIGYAGSSNFEIGTAMEVSEARLNHTVAQYDEPACMLATTGELPSAVCYSSTDFVTQSDLQDCLFDMEIAFIAALGFRNLRSIKLVSDNLSIHDYRKFGDFAEPE